MVYTGQAAQSGGEPDELFGRLRGMGQGERVTGHCKPRTRGT
jgi:hypothetical protein